MSWQNKTLKQDRLILSNLVSLGREEGTELPFSNHLVFSATIPAAGGRIYIYLAITDVRFFFNIYKTLTTVMARFHFGENPDVTLVSSRNCCKIYGFTIKFLDKHVI